MHKYIKYLRETGRDPAAQTYGSMLRSFALWLKPRGTTIDTATANDVEEFMRTRSSASTANTFRAAMCGFVKFQAGQHPYADPQMLEKTHRVNQLALIPNVRRSQTLRKKALTPTEVRQLLKTIRAGKPDPVLFAGVVLQFYFGWRPVEGAVFLRDAQVDWDDRSMVIKIAKRFGAEHILPWHPVIDPYLTTWCEALPVPGDNEWLTKRVKRYSVGGLRLKAYTGRKTVETQFRLAGVDDFITDQVLGHVSRSSPIGDVYTDLNMFKEKIRTVMETQHYLVPILAEFDG